MKFFAILAALVAVAAGQSTWTLAELSDAIQNPNTNPAILPYLEQALNEMMEDIFAGKPVESVTVTIPAVIISSWSLNEISDALQNPNTDPALIPYLEQALNNMMDALFAEEAVPVAPVTFPEMEVTAWTLQELSEALGNPATNPALVPYLEAALNDMMDALFNGNDMEAIVVAIPAGLEPIVPAPVVPAPIEAVVPEETQVPVPAASSPLVQIIVNVQ